MDLRGSVRRQGLGGRAEVEEGALGEPDGAPSAVDGDGAPSRRGRGGGRIAVNPAKDLEKIAVVTPGDSLLAPTVGSTNPPSPPPWRSRRASPGRDRGRPGLRAGEAFSRVSSESLRKRLATRSMRSSSSSSSSDAAKSAPTLVERAPRSCRGHGSERRTGCRRSIGLGHQLDPLVTGGGTEQPVARSTAEGGSSEELGEPAAWPLLPEGAVVAPAVGPAGGAAAVMPGQSPANVDAQPTAAMLATPIAAVMLESLLSAPSRRMAAAWRRCAGLACLTRPIASTVRTNPDAHMKSEGLRLKIH